MPYFSHNWDSVQQNRFFGGQQVRSWLDQPNNPECHAWKNAVRIPTGMVARAYPANIAANITTAPAISGQNETKNGCENIDPMSSGLSRSTFLPPNFSLSFLNQAAPHRIPRRRSTHWAMKHRSCARAWENAARFRVRQPQMYRVKNTIRVPCGARSPGRLDEDDGSRMAVRVNPRLRLPRRGAIVFRP